MKINLSPQRRNDKITVIKQDDIITINGVSYDFSELPDGATLPFGSVQCDFIVDDVHRIDGELELTIILPHGMNASYEARFPQPLLNVPNGKVELPE